MDHMELKESVRESIKQLVSLSLLVSAGGLPEQSIAERIADIANKLKDGLCGKSDKASVGIGSVAYPENIKSVEERIQHLDEEIQELYRFIHKYGMNHEYPSKGLQVMENAKRDLEAFRDSLEKGKKQMFIEHPAHKAELSDERILAEYKKLKSFRAVARILECDPKTVKNRLEKMGYFKK